MKKNGKKYRKQQKEKEIRRRKKFTNDINKEVDGIKTADLAMAQIVTENPIVYDVKDTKKLYLDMLIKYLKMGGWNKRKYECAVMKAYRNIISANNEVKQENSIGFYKYYILFDLLHILGYPIEKISLSKIDGLLKQYALDFGNVDPSVVKKIINSVQGDEKRLTNLMKNDTFSEEKQYIELIRKNILFRKQTPFNIMVTATMSAGKSTFINSLIGKYVCLSQNMACTSKIHSVINKAFEDGYSSEYDYDLVMTAGKEELLSDNEKNQSDVIFVATNFVGRFSDSRIIVNDSPGVNFSGNQEHQKIANKLIKSRNYGMLIYVLNATQLGTNDDDKHLDFVKQTIGRTPVIFVVNKVDLFNPDEENIEDIISRQTSYLISKGFKNPLICPVSARAGYLAKQRQNGTLTRSEERELYNFVDKFDKMGISNYYSINFPKIQILDSKQEEIQLLKTCGLAYIEEILKGYTEGGK